MQGTKSVTTIDAVKICKSLSVLAESSKPAMPSKPTDAKSRLIKPITNTSENCAGKCSRLKTTGANACWSHLRNPTKFKTEIITELIINNGTASDKKFQTLKKVFSTIFLNKGILIGGKSINKSVASPFNNLLSTVPVKTIKTNIINIYKSQTLNPPIAAKRAVIIPCWAAHGMVTPRIAVAIVLSFLDPRILVVIVPKAPQPKPKIKGITARPFNPILFNTLSAKTAKRGR